MIAPAAIRRLEKALGFGLPSGTPRAAARDLAKRVTCALRLVSTGFFPIPLSWRARAVHVEGAWLVEVRVDLDTVDLRLGAPRCQSFGERVDATVLVPEAFCALVRRLGRQALQHEFDEALVIAGARPFNPHARKR